MTTSMTRAYRPSTFPTRMGARSKGPVIQASPIKRQPVMSGRPATAGGGATGGGV